MRASVLVAHPEANERARLVALVRDAGLEPVEADDGEVAIARGRDASLALLSPLLQRGDGLSVAGRLRAGGRRNGPAVVLLNDVYPVSHPKDSFLREFGLSEVLAAPAEAGAVSDLLGRLRRLPRRAVRDSRATDLAETPLVLVLARARSRHETAFVYARRDQEALFLTLVGGDVAQVRHTDGNGAGDEATLTAALGWASGTAMLIPDPGIEETSTGRIDLLPLLDAATATPAAPELLEAARRNLARTGRVVVQVGDASLIDRVGATAFERQLLEIADGERSLGRIAGLAEVGSLPLARLLLRLEATTLLRRRRPGAKRPASATRAAFAGLPLLPAVTDAVVPATGGLGRGDLARLLVRCEQARASGVLAVRRDGRTIELALTEGRLTGANFWGSAAEEDPVAKLAGVSDLRPEDVPVIRQLHSQRLVIDSLTAAEAEWSMRTADTQRVAGSLTINPAAMVAELLRDDRIELSRDATRAPAADVAGAFGLTAVETGEVHRWASGGTPPARAWLRALPQLLDTSAAIGSPVGSRRALPAAPHEQPPAAQADIDQLLDQALDEGIREGTRAGAPRADSKASGAAPSPAPTLEQTAGGVVVRVGDRQYEIATLVGEVDDMRREVQRLRGELGRRNEELSEREGEVAAVQGTAHELENFIVELRSTMLEKEAAVEDATASRGQVEAELAGLQVVIGEKDSQLQEATGRREEAALELRARVVDLEQRERQLTDLGRERDGLRQRTSKLEQDLERRAAELREREEQVRLATERRENAERDLKLVRTERDELAARVRPDSEREAKRGLFGARRQEAEPDPKRLDEQRAELGALRAEAEELRHRVIDLEGQLSRRDAELGRHRRERERLEERLNTADVELTSRGEDQTAHRARWEKAERLLAERTTALELREQELEALRAHQGELEGELARARKELIDRDQRLTEVTDERTEQSARIAQVESHSSRLTADLAAASAERDQLRVSLDDTRSGEARTRSELDRSRSTRKEMAARLAEALAARTAAEEQREHTAAGARRLEAELDAEQEARSAERAALEGTIDAREEELAALTRRHQETMRELGDLRDRLPTLKAAADEATEQAHTLERSVSQYRASSKRLEADLEAARSEVERAEREVRSLTDQRAGDLASWRDERAALRSELDREIEQKTRTETRLSAALHELEKSLDRMPALKHELDASSGQVATLEKARADARTELVQLRSALEAIEEERNERASEAQRYADARDSEQRTWSAERQSLREQIDRSRADREQLETRLDGALRELQTLLDQVPVLKRESISAQERVKSLETELESSTTDHDRLARELATARERAQQEVERAEREREKATELNELVNARNAMLTELRIELDAGAEERHQLEAGARRELAERDERIQRLETQLSQTLETDANEIASWKSRAQRFEESLGRLTEQNRAHRDHTAEQKTELERLGAQVNTARKRTAHDLRRVSELVALVDDKEARLKERETQLRSLQAEMTQREQDAERLSSELQARRQELDAAHRLADERGQALNESRENAVRLGQLNRELGEQAQLGRAELDSLRTGLARVSEDKARALEQLKEEQARAERESQVTGRAMNKIRADLQRLRDESKAAGQRERGARARLAQREKEIAEAQAKGEVGVNEVALLKRVAEMNTRIQNLEQELALASATDTDLRQQLDTADAKLQDISRTSEAAQRSAARTSRELDREKTAASGLSERVRELEAALADRDQTLEIRDLMVAEHETSLAEVQAEALAARDKLTRTVQSASQMEGRVQRDGEELGQVRSALKRALEQLARRDAELARLRPPKQSPPAVASSAPATPAAAAPTRSNPTTAEETPDLETLDALFAEADAAVAAPPAAVREPRLVDLVAEKQTLLDASIRLNRELTRLRDELEKRAAELASLDDDPSGDIAPDELEARRVKTETELHQIQSSLGAARVKMADINRQIMDKTRQIQGLQEGASGESSDSNLLG